MAETPGVSLTITQQDAITPALARLARNAKNAADIYDQIGAANVLETQMRFEAEEGPDGRRWVAHSDVTLDLKQTKGITEPRKLRESTDLYDSIAHRVLPSGGVQIGVTRTYGRIHQLGGQAGRGRKVKIPARPYLGISEDGKREIEAIISDALGKGVA